MPSTLCQTVPFVHPTIAGIALATGLVPVLVHLINRRRYRRVPWAAMALLLAANRRSARRMRLEQWLLMLARIAVIVLLGLAVARPFVPSSPMLPLGPSRSHRIILLDNSRSMSARRTDGERRFDVGKRVAQRLLATFPAADAVSLVTLARPAEAVIGHAAYDRRVVRERLAAIQPTQRDGDIAEALDLTQEILEASESAEGNRAVYLVCDFARADWLATPLDKATGTADTDGSPSAVTPAITAVRRLADAMIASGTDLHLVGVAGGRGNVAVTQLAADSPMVAVDLPIQMTAEVTNYGTTTVRQLALQFQRDGEILRRERLPPIEPGATGVSTVTLAFSTPGTHAVTARVLPSGADDLDNDNARYLSIDVRSASKVLLIDGRPGSTLLAGQAGFLATALAPAMVTGSSEQPHMGAARLPQPSLFEPKVISEPELEGEVPSEYDVIALCNVARLSDHQWQYLERFVTQGGGLLIFVGDLLNTDNYNRFGYDEGDGLLPGSLGRIPVGPSAENETIGFQFGELLHPVVAEFAGHAGSGLFNTRVDRYLPMTPDPDRADVALTYTNGKPALVAARFGKGRVLFCTTSADMAWNNLPAKGDYVSLVIAATAYLSPSRGDHRNVAVGHRILEPLTPVQSSLPLRVTESDGESSEARLVPGEDSLLAEYGPVERAGVLTVSIGKEHRHFAANVDPHESDLITVEPGKLAAVIDRPVRFLREDELDRALPVTAKSSELASAGFYVVIALLLVEMWMAMWFGSHRARHG